MSAWQPIDTAPRDGTHILLLYYKGGRSSRTRVSHEYVVTEAFYIPGYFSEWDKQCTYPRGQVWYDHLERLICSDRAKVKKNIPTHWMPLPELPPTVLEEGE